MAAHVKRRDYEDRVDSEYGLRALRADIDHHLAHRPLINSTYHDRRLPVNLCDEIVSKYSTRGWLVDYNILDTATVFSFMKSSFPHLSG